MATVPPDPGSGLGEVPQAPFGKLRQLLWPIHRRELPKVLPMLLMFFFISLVYSLLRNTKDTLIVTSSGGADLIPFLKVYGVIPMSVLYMLAYARLSNRVGRRKLFLGALAPFAVFFALFVLLYPIRESLQPVAWAGRMEARLPHGLGSLVELIRHWVLALFYVMAELWGSAALSLLFWGFANDITRVDEAKRFYALFGIGANLALVAVKFVNAGIHRLEHFLVRWGDLDRWSAYIFILMLLVEGSILIIATTYLWLSRREQEKAMAAEGAGRSSKAAKKPSMGWSESVRFLLRSKALLYIAILVIAYGISLNLIEVTWKSYLRLRFPNPLGYQDFMSNYSFAVGATTIFLMLFVASNVIRTFGWTVAAMVTPVVLLATGAGFFGFLLCKTDLAPLLAQYHTTPLAVGVLFGTVQNIMSKAAKYSLFDPTKEMAYIPLDPEAKVKGKAAIDVVGARLGKAGGSIIQQVLIGIYGSLLAVTGHIAVLLFAIIAIWIWADLRLGREFARLTRPRNQST